MDGWRERWRMREGWRGEEEYCAGGAQVERDKTGIRSDTSLSTLDKILLI